MPEGRVKFFNASKGFGFITPDEGEKDVFLPATSLTEAGICKLEPGQRLSFEIEPQAKGPKAVKLSLLADAEPVAVPRASAIPPRNRAPRLTFYHDPNSDDSVAALDEIRAAGQQPQVIDYFANPLGRDELRNLSVALRRNGQSLIRKYDALFSELRLDDRFLTENEVWDAVIEHPSLINGPIVATTTEAMICQSPKTIAEFLNAIAHGAPVAAKPKALSDRALRFLRGEPVLSLPAQEEDALIPVAQIEKRIQEHVAVATAIKIKQGKTKLRSNAEVKLETGSKGVRTSNVRTSVKARRRAKA